MHDDPAALGETFRFRFSRPYAVAALPFGVTAQTTSLVVTIGLLRIRFGPWRLETPLTNIARTEVTGPYSFLKTAGPAHLSFSDHGVTFATNGERGTCIQLHEPVRALNPFGRPRHPNVTVTVEDPARLADVLGPR